MDPAWTTHEVSVVCGIVALVFGSAGVFVGLLTGIGALQDELRESERKRAWREYE